MKLHRPPRVVDALSPLDTIIGALLTVMVFIVVAGGLVAAFSGATWSDIDSPTICTDTNFSYGGDADPLLVADQRRSLGLARGVEVEELQSTACQSDPSAGQRVLQAFKTQPTLIVFIAFLVLTQRTIRAARRDGLFTQRLAGRVERVGWLLLLGLLGAAAVEWLADGLLRSTMWDTDWLSGSFTLSVAGLIGAFGIVTVGRVMARAADLAEDVQGTV